MNRLYWYCLTVLFTTVLVAQPADDVIELFVGEQKSINVKDAAQIFIAGQGKVARGSLVEGGSQVVLSGVQPGAVSLTVNYKDGSKEAFSLRVVGRETEELYAEVRRLLADYPALKVRRVGQGVELAGEVNSVEEERRVSVVSERYPEVLNFTRDGRADQLIQMDMEVVEVSASDVSNLGIDWFAATDTRANFSGGVDYGNVAVEGNAVAVGEKSIPSRVFPRPQYAVGPFARLNPLTARLDFLVGNGKGDIRARPKLVCRSGDSARFMAGGEVPLPYATRDQIEVNWKPYGIRLDVKPVLLKSQGNALEIGIDCEISDLDWGNRVDRYPALTRQAVATKVKLNAGEMLALAGLISKKKFRTQKRLPFLGAIPYLGRLFSSTRDEVRDMETVILLSPKIVRPETADR